MEETEDLSDNAMLVLQCIGHLCNYQVGVPVKEKDIEDLYEDLINRHNGNYQEAIKELNDKRKLLVN